MSALRLTKLTLLALLLCTAGARAQQVLYFVHTDHLNTPRLISNASQQAVWKWDQQEAFGDNVADQNPSGLGNFDLPLRLPGQYFDQETSLHYNVRRDYDVESGRYAQSDPLGIRAGLNTYAYARNNPLRFLDPDGAKPYLFRVTVGGGVSVGPVPGQVFNLAVTDPIAGETCNYTVSCIGIGWSYKDTASFTIGGGHVKWDDHKQCSNCRQFEGAGMAGSIAIQVGPIGYTPVDWLDVPNGPRLDFSGWSPTTVNIGGGTMDCRFMLR